MTAPTDTPWTPERVELLEIMAAEGETASVIGAELGITRNAVIGKIHRMGLDWDSAKSRHKDGRPAPKRNERQRFRMPVKPVERYGRGPSSDAARLSKKAQENPDQPNPKHRRKKCTLVDLRADSCRWPLGDDLPGSPDFRFCGAKAIDGYPYCSDHCRMAYQPARQRNAA